MMQNVWSVVIGTVVLLCGHVAVAGQWIDEDGESFVVIEESRVKLVDTSSFYWFDKVFEIATSGEPVFLCVGEETVEEFGPVCVMGPVSIEVSNKGRVRTIIFDTDGGEFFCRAIERELAEGKTMKVSATDGNIFYSAVVHKDYKLKKSARDVLSR